MTIISIIANNKDKLLKTKNVGKQKSFAPYSFGRSRWFDGKVGNQTGEGIQPSRKTNTVVEAPPNRRRAKKITIYGHLDQKIVRTYFRSLSQESGQLATRAKRPIVIIAADLALWHSNLHFLYDDYSNVTIKVVS